MRIVRRRKNQEQREREKQEKKDARSKEREEKRLKREAEKRRKEAIKEKKKREREKKREERRRKTTEPEEKVDEEINTESEEGFNRRIIASQAQKGKKVKITYRSRGDRSSSTRTVEPYSYRNKRGGVFLFAWHGRIKSYNTAKISKTATSTEDSAVRFEIEL